VTRRSIAIFLSLVLLALGCSREAAEVHSVRGQVSGLERGGRALAVDHEAIPGVMDAMKMTLPLIDPKAASDLAPGDKIRFDFYLSDGVGSIGSIEKLPAETELALATGHADHAHD
jgi:Cu/Ag efflux protein CusF